MNALAHRLAAQCAARPGAPALVCGAQTWSYGQLAAEIGSCREGLRQQGLGPGTALGWLGLNSVPMLVALFACARLGARFVPLNWRLTPVERQALADHAGLSACHADADFELPTIGPAQAGADASEDDLLLVYTSGTGGELKGAIHTQAAMLANVDAAIEAQELSTQTRALAVLPLFHVGGLCIQTLPVLAAGGVVKLQARFDAGAWLNDVQAWRPTTSLLVPATMRALVEHPRWAATDLSSLDFINSGSQVIPRPLIDAFHARGVPVCQVYGATETGPVSLVLRPDEALSHPGKAGRPARGVQVRLVDGEVHVHGPNLARAYHRRAGDAAFEGGWFRTGDLAHVDEQGYYEIIGRASERIVSGGEKIDPVEIEQIALADAAVAEAAVVGLPDPRWGEVPVLALVLRPGAVVDLERLRSEFALRLARFKHPQRIAIVEALPRTALGKVRKDALARQLA